MVARLWNLVHNLPHGAGGGSSHGDRLYHRSHPLRKRYPNVYRFLVI